MALAPTGLDRLMEAARDPQPSGLQRLMDAAQPSNVSRDTPQVVHAIGEFFRGVAGQQAAIPKEMAMAAKTVHDAFHEAEQRQDLDDYKLYRLGQSVEDFVDSYWNKNPDLAESFAWGTLPRGAGNIAGFILGGAVGRGLKMGRAGLATLTGLSAAGLEAEQQYKSLKGSKEQRFLAAQLAMPLGALEAVLPTRVFRKWDKATGGKFKASLRRLAKEGFEGSLIEGVTEILQQVGGNTIAKQIYDADRPLFEGVAESGGAGGILGGLTGVLTTAIGGRRGSRAFRHAQEQRAAGQRADVAMKTMYSTPEFAQEFAARSPEQAQKVADIEGDTMSRAQLRELAGLSGRGWVSQSRSAFLRNVRTQIEYERTQTEYKGEPTDAVPTQETPEARREEAARQPPETAQRAVEAEEALKDAFPPTPAHRMPAIGWNELAKQIIARSPIQARQLAQLNDPSAQQFADLSGIATSHIFSEGWARRGFAATLAHEMKKQGREPAEQAPAAAEEAIKEPTPEDAVETDRVALSVRQGAQKPINLLRRMWRSRGGLPEPVFQSKIKATGAINAQMKEIAFTLRDFKKAAKQAYKGGATPADTAALDMALKGQAPVEGTLDAPSAIPPAMRPVLRKMRDQIDGLSSALVDSGAISGPLELKIAENMGVYAHRSYQVFDDPDWADKVPESIRNRAKAWVREQYPNLSDEQIEGKFQKYLYAGRLARSPIAFLAGGQLGKKDLGILMKRKAIPAPLRALWGEYINPVVNYSKSVSKMVHLLENHKLLEEIRGAGVGKFLFETPTANEGGQFIEPIAAKGNEPMAPLAGLHTTPEIADAFRRNFDPQPLEWWWRYLLLSNGLVKYSKTVLSGMTHKRNLIANVGFEIANGRWRVGKAAPAVNATLASLGARNSKDWREYYKKMLRLGVVHESARAGELQDVIRDATTMSAEDFMFSATTQGMFRRGARGVGKAATALYRAEDEVWKVYAFENEKARYRKALPNASEAELDAVCAQIVRDTCPTYSLIPDAVKKLRRFPVVGAFVSFPAEVLRTSYKTLRLTAHELGRPELRHIGAQRASGVLAASVVTSTLSNLSRYMFGTTEQDEDDMRRFVAPWSENSEMIHLPPTGEGKRRFIDLSYTDPYETMRKPMMALLRGEDWEEALWRSAWEGLEPFLGEEILFGKALDVWRNSTRTDAEVYSPTDPVWKQTVDMAEHLWEAFEPGELTSQKRMWKAWMGRVNDFGRSYDVGNEFWAWASGFRITEVDIPQSLSWRARDFKRELSHLSRKLSSTAGRRGAVTDAKLVSVYQSTERTRAKTYAAMSETVSAARRLGVKEDRIMDILRAAGLTWREVGDLIEGEYRPYMPTSQFLSSKRKTAEALPAPGAAGHDEYWHRYDVITNEAEKRAAP